MVNSIMDNVGNGRVQGKIVIMSEKSKSKAASRASLVLQRVKNLHAIQETWVSSLGREDLLEKGMPGEFHGQRSLASYSLWGCRESDMTERLMFSLFKAASSAAIQKQKHFISVGNKKFLPTLPKMINKFCGPSYAKAGSLCALERHVGQMTYLSGLLFSSTQGFLRKMHLFK